MPEHLNTRSTARFWLASDPAGISPEGSATKGSYTGSFRGRVGVSFSCQASAKMASSAREAPEGRLEAGEVREGGDAEGGRGWAEEYGGATRLLCRLREIRRREAPPPSRRPAPGSR